MNRRLKYLITALLTFLAGASVYFILSPGRTQSHIHTSEPPIRFVSNSQHGGQPCLAHTAYRFEDDGNDDTGPVSPYCAKLQMDLLQAATSRNIETTRRLLSEGANANSPGLSGGDYSYPLIGAAFAGDTGMVRLLLDNGADVNWEHCCCMSCSTALTYAVEAGNVELVKLLLARGADVHYISHYDEDQTLQQKAEGKGNKEITAMLDEAGATSWPHRAASRLDRLLRRGVN